MPVSVLAPSRAVFAKSLGCQTGLRQDIVVLWLLIVYLCGECEMNSLDSGSGSFEVSQGFRFGGFGLRLRVTQLFGISEFPYVHLIISLI